MTHFSNQLLACCLQPTVHHKNSLGNLGWSPFSLKVIWVKFLGRLFPFISYWESLICDSFFHLQSTVHNENLPGGLWMLRIYTRDNRSRFGPFFWSGMSFRGERQLKSSQVIVFNGLRVGISAGCFFFQRTDSFDFGIHINHKLYSVRRVGVKSRGLSSAYRVPQCS